MSVSRETLGRLERLTEEWGLPPDAPERLSALLELVASDPAAPSSVTQPGKAVDIHVADSLTALAVPALRSADTIVDIGSGPGFPGLALAIALPGTRFHLVESAGKKCAFLERAIEIAGLPNAVVVCRRAEEWALGEGAEGSDAVTVRAVDSLPTIAEYAAPLLRVGGVLVAWKGARREDDEERGGRAAGTLGMAPKEVLRVHPFPGAREHHLHVYEKLAPTPAGFPRRPGMARKRPLG